MKRILGFALCAAALGLYIAGQNSPTELTQAVQNGEMIRLHVVASSDDAKDQETKLIVRDAVIALCGSRLEAARGAEEMEGLLKDMLPEIEHTARQAAASNGAAAAASASFGLFAFPERTYAGELVPAGEYKALRVVLGDGRGANWWCVMYPPLCFIGEEAVDPGEKIEVKFESAIAKWFRGDKD